MIALALASSLLAAAPIALAASQDVAPPVIHRVTTVSPFPRGLAIVDGDLYVLSRGRVRDAGGVAAGVDDKAGTIHRVDPDVAQPATEPEVSDAVRNNGEPFALPTSPPFNLWDEAADPPHSDRETDRPYCGLRWHEPTHSFYICAYAGVDKPGGAGGRNFSKNLTDAVLRFDTRTGLWSEVERHDTEAGGIYPHNDPGNDAPPHGWVNGPDNLLPLGDWLYVVAKDNSVLVRYDLTQYVDDPSAGAAPSEFILGAQFTTTNAGAIDFLGHSGLAERDGWLYVASRTSSHIIRMRLDDAFNPVAPHEIELLAQFQPWTRQSRATDITDIAFDDAGRLYVVGAMPSRVFRFTPDPSSILDARDGSLAPWVDFAAATNNPRMKSENILVHDNRLYITSGDGYGFQGTAAGTVYRVDITD